jgi:hypothetical protein
VRVLPYIPRKYWEELEPHSKVPAFNEGELNFQLTSVIIEYALNNGLNYATIGDIQGALRNAGVEFDRRVTGPYENTKIAQNGDVYESVFLDNPTVFAGIGATKR